MSLRGRVGKKCRAKDEEPKTDLYLDLISHLSLLCLYFRVPSPISVHQRSSVVPVPRLLSFCPNIFLPIRFSTEALLYTRQLLRWHTTDWEVRRTGGSELEG